MSTKTNSRKILVPLATLLVAAAVAVGSGATFTSTSDSRISASAGNLVHANSKHMAALTVTNLKPGATETGSLTITNAGSLDSVLTVAPSGNADTFGSGAVTLTIESIHGAATEVEYTGNFAGLTSPLTLGDLTAGLSTEDSITVRFTVSMAAGAGNVNQSKAAGVSLNFVTTQTAASNNESVVSWIPFV